MAYAVTINPISSDGIINAAEKTAGVTISGTTSVSGGTVTLNVGGQNRTATVTGTTWSYTLTTPDFTNMGQGAEAITATANFGGGNTATSKRTITVDTLPPVLTITDSVPSGDATGLVTYTFTFSEPVTGFAASDITVTGATKRTETFTMLSSTVYTMAVMPTAGTTGSISVSVAVNSVFDTVGNGNALTTAASQTYNTVVAPVSADLNTIAITYVADNHGTLQGNLQTMPSGSTTSDNGLGLSGTLSGGLSAGDVVKVFDGATLLGDATVSGNTWIYTDDTRTLVDAQTVNYTVQVVGTLVSSTPSTVFTTTVDKIAPTITAQISDINGTVTGGSTSVAPILQGTTSSSLAAGDEVHVYRRGFAPGSPDTSSNVEIGTATPTSGTTWSYTDSSALVDGNTYVYTVLVWDAAGNPSGDSAKEYRIAFDNASAAPPVITGITADTGTSASDGITSDKNLDISGTGETNASIQVFKNGVSIGTTTANFAGDWQFNYTATTLADGTYTFSAKQTDVAGNPPSGFSAGYQVTVDTVFASAKTTAITAVADDAGGITGNLTTGGVTDDTSLALSGTISAALVTGEAVGVYDGATRLGTATMTGATTWTYTDATLADLDVASYTARVEDLAGNGATASPAFTATIDTSMAPDNDAIVDAVTDNVAPDTGFIVSGGATNDPTPLISGTITLALSVPLDQGASVQVYRDGILLPGAATVVGTNWTYTDTLPAGDAIYSYTAAVWDTAGNPTFPGDAYIIDAQLTPPAINSNGASFASGANAVVTIDFSETITATDAGGSPITIDGGIPGGLVIQQNGAGGNIIFPVATGTTVTPTGLTMNTSATLDQTDFLLIGYDSTVANGILDVSGNEPVSFSWAVGGTDFNTIDMGAYATRALNIEGKAGDDTITGSTAFADTLSGGDGDDTFIYTTATSFYNAGALVDSVDGGAGTDTVRVAGAITLTTANKLGRLAAVEQLVATDVTTLLTHSIALNVLSANASLNTIDLSLNTNAGSTAVINLTGMTTGMTIKGVSAGANTVTGGTGADIITGGSNDIFIYAASSDFANGTALTDSINGGAGTDTVQIAGAISLNLTDFSRLALVEQLVAAADSAALTHSIVLGANSSLNTVNLSANTSTGSSAVIDVAGVTTAMTITGITAGSNTLTGGTGADNITGGTGNDTITGGEGANTITGGAGVDIISAGTGADIFYYASASDFASSAVVTDSINGGGGTDTVQITGAISLNISDLSRLTSVEKLVATSETILSPGLAHNIVLSANSSLNTIDLSPSGSSTSTAVIDLTGVTAAMTIKGVSPSGGSARSTITGGTGADTITGSGNNDLFIYHAMSDFVSGGAVVDLINGGSGTNTIRIEGAIDLGVTNPGDTLAGRVSNFQQLTAAASSADLTHGIVLTDATRTSITTIDLSLNTGAGSSGRIDLNTVTAAMTLKGVAAGSNTLIGGTGADTIVGGASADIITAGNGANSITGGAGVDTISAGTGADLFYFAASSDFANGASVTDLIDGGGGTDTIQVAGAISLNLTDLSRLTSVEQLVAASGAALSHNIALGANSSLNLIDLTLTTGATSTSVINLTGVTSAMTIRGVAAGANTVTGGAGADTIAGGNGNDSFLYSAMSDFIAPGGAMIDSLSGGAASAADAIWVTGPITLTTANSMARALSTEILYTAYQSTANLTHNIVINDTSNVKLGGIRTIDLSPDSGVGSISVIDLTGVSIAMTIKGVAAGTNTITGNSANDIIYGGAGIDVLNGGSGTGNDTFVYATSSDFSNLGAVVDSIDGGAHTTGDKIQVAGAINLTGSLARAVNVEQLVAATQSTAGQAHSITAITDFSNFTTIDLSLDTNTLSTAVIDLTGATANMTIKGVNGAALTSTNSIIGGSGDDIITGSSIGIDTIDGGAGNDSIIGGAGNGANFIIGGAGLDTLTGGNLVDTFIFNASSDFTSGGLVIDSISGAGGGADKIQVAGGISVTSLARAIQTEQLVAATESTSVNNHSIVLGASTDLATFNTIDLSGDANTSSSAVINLTGVTSAMTIKGVGAGTSSVIGGTGADTITGGAGIDTINGGDGANSIIGGGGADILSAGTGADIFYYAASSDFVTTGAVVDTIDGGITGIDTVKVEGAIAITGSLARAGGVEQLVAATQSAAAQAHNIALTDMSNFTTIDLSPDTNTVSTSVIDLTGVTTNMTIKGVFGLASTSTNSIIGGSGNDTIICATVGGGIGNDTLDGGAGNDTIYGGNGANIITGGIGVDIITVGTGNDSFLYNAMSDFVASNAVIDSVNGNAGFDAIWVTGPINLVAADSMARVVNTEVLYTGYQNSANLTHSILINDSTNVKLGSIRYIDLSADSGAGSNAMIDLTGVGGAAAPMWIRGAAGAASANTIIGGSGNDTIVSVSSVETLAGGGGNDTFYYTAESEFSNGAAVIDSIDGGAGTDSVMIEGEISLNAADLSRLTTVERLVAAANTGAILTHNIARADTDMGSLTTIDLSLDTNIDSSATFNLSGVSAKTIKGVGAGSNTFVYDAMSEFAVSTSAGGLRDALTGGTGTDTVQIAGAITLSGSFSLSLGTLTSVEQLVATTQNTAALAHSILLPTNNQLGTITTIDLSGDGAAGSNSTIVLTNAAAALTIKGVSAGANTITGGTNINGDTITGGSVNDTFYYSTWGLYFTSAAGVVIDSINGGGGTDTVQVIGNLTLYGPDPMSRLVSIERLVLASNPGSPASYYIAIDTNSSLNTIDLSADIYSANPATIDLTGVTTAMTIKGVAASGLNTITGGSGADTITSYSGNDVFRYNAMSDFVAGGAVVDSISAGPGTDKIMVAGQIDLGYTNPSDTLAGRLTLVEQLTAAAQNTAALAHNIVLNADAKRGGITTIDLSLDTGAASSSVINLNGVTAAMAIKGVSVGSNTLIGGSGNDTIFGGDGVDVLDGGGGDDTYSYNAMTDLFSASGVIDTFVAGAGINSIQVLAGGMNVNTLAGLTSVQQLTAYNLNTNFAHNISLTDATKGSITTINLLGDTGRLSSAVIDLSGVSTAMTIKGVTGGYTAIFTGSNTLTGGSGNDTIYGGYGADTITGGAGVDVLYGSPVTSNTIYNVNTFAYAAMSDFVTGGAVVDSIIGGGSTGADIIRVAGGITLTTGDSLARMSSINQLVAAPSSGLLVHSIALTQAQLGGPLTVIDLSGDTYSGSSATIDLGSVVSAVTLNGVLYGSNTITGGSGADIITGHAGNDSLTGGDGNNYIAAGAGNDVLTSGTGIDTLYGGAGDDTLSAGLGNDILNGGSGIDILNGGDGDDTFVFDASSDFMVGSVAVDVIDGGAGTADTIQLRQLLSTDAVTWTSLPAVTGIERLIFTSTWGLTYRMTLNETTRNGFDYIDLSGNTGIRSTSVIDLTGVTANMTIKGVSAWMNSITGGSGADTLTGGAGTDDFYYHSMSDFMTTNAVVDSIDGAGGADRIWVTGPITLTTADSMARVVNTEILYTAAQSAAPLTHSIEINASANLGSIRYIDLVSDEHAGSGAVVNLAGVTDAMWMRGVKFGNNTLTGGTGADIIYSRSGTDVLSGGDGNDTFVFVAMTDFYNGGVVDSISGGNGIDKIAFTNGITLAATDMLNTSSLTGIEQLAAMTSSASANSYNIALSEAGRGGIDTIDLSGNIRNASTAIIDMSAVTTGMVLTGLSMGSNTLTGGSGNDTITGGYGSDVFAYAAMSDFYSGGVVDSITGSLGYDFISVANGITLGTTDTLTPGLAGVEQLRAAAQNTAALAHSIVLDASAKLGGISAIVLAADTGAGSSGAINLTGVTTATTLYGVGAGINSIVGGSANDGIYGGAVNDTITGAGGVDTISGGGGDDTFIYNAWSDFVTGTTVFDSINGGAGTDKIQVAGAFAIAGATTLARAGTSEQLVAAAQSSANLTHSIGISVQANLGTIRTIDLSGDTGATSSASISLVGAVTSAVTLKGVNGASSSNAISGGSGADTITGGSSSSGNDTLTGGAGVDVLYGGDGTNTFGYGSMSEFYTTAGGIVDSITGGAGTDKIKVTGAIALTTADTLASARMTGVEQLIATTAATVTVNSIVLNTDAKLGGITTIDLSGNTGATSTATINMTGVTTGMTIKGVNGATSSNIITGGTGVDTLAGGAGTDIFAYNAMSDFVSAGTGAVIDSFTGGNGTDTIRVTGLIDLGYTNTSDTLAGLTGSSVEQLQAAAQSTAAQLHNIVLTEAKLGSINAIDLSLDTNAGSSSNIDLSGVTTGMTIKGVAAGINSIIGGTGNDIFSFVAGTGLLGTDTVYGGAGTDTVALTGNVAVAATDFDHVNNIEVITLQNSSTAVAITTQDTLVGNTDTLTLSATSLVGVGAVLTFNGALETGGGKFNITGGGAADVITGGSGNDTITGGAAADTITGGIGADVIYLTETTQVVDTVTINAGDSLATGIDQIRNFNAVAAATNDQLNLVSTTLAAATAGTDGATNYGTIKSHAITAGHMISFDDLDAYAAPLVINAANIADVNNYMATNIASGDTIAFYVDASGNGTYGEATDYLRVFQGGATAAGSLSTDDTFVDIFTTSGLGGVTALSLAAAANTVVIV